MSKTTYFVYEHVFPNGYLYTGITNNIDARWGYEGVGYKQNEKMFSAINEYGWENIDHMILAYGLSAEEAKAIETKRIQENIKKGKRIYNSMFNYGKEEKTNFFCADVTRIINSAMSIEDTERLGRYYKLFANDKNKAMIINILHTEILNSPEYEAATNANTDEKTMIMMWFKAIKKLSAMGSIVINIPSEFIPNFS